MSTEENRHLVARVNEILRQSFGWSARGNRTWNLRKGLTRFTSAGGLDYITKGRNIFEREIGEFRSRDGSKLVLLEDYLFEGQKYSLRYKLRFGKEPDIEYKISL
jgi:hypothetical protein